MKACPYCAEQIQNEAIICRYCGNDTRIPVPPPPNSGEPSVQAIEEPSVKDQKPNDPPTMQVPPEISNLDKNKRPATTTEKLAGVVLILSIFAALYQLRPGVSFEGRLTAYTIPFVNVGLVLLIGGAIRLARGETEAPNSRLLVILGLVSILALPLFYFLFGYLTGGGSQQSNNQELQSSTALSPTRTLQPRVFRESECISSADNSTFDFQGRLCIKGVVESYESVGGGNSLAVLAGGDIAILDKSDFPTIYPEGTCVWGAGVIRSGSYKAKNWLELDSPLKKCESTP